MKAPYRILAFIGKEIQAIVVQPQLLLLLVVGPFAVLLAFGLGYQPQSPLLRTIVVQAAPDNPNEAIGYYLSAIGPPLRIVQVTPDLAGALQQLQARQVDLVIVVPTGIRDTLLSGKSAQLQFYHNAIDPQQVGYISAVVDGTTSQLNRAITKQAIGEQQASAADYEQVLRDVQGALGGIQDATQKGDRQQAQQMARSVRIDSELLASLWLFGAAPLSDPGTPALALAAEARQLDTQLAAPQTQPQDVNATIAKMQGDTDTMLQAVKSAQQIPPDVLVAPLTSEAKNVSTYQPGYVAFHSPTVLALLVQHLCVTLAALSLVDERNAGALELFRVAPVSPAEVLVGKFLAYLLVVAVTTVGLVILLIHGLHVPLLGNWRWLAAVIVALIAYSLNLGFLISAIANSRSQAIQMSMLVLLGSIFFSGFFVPLQDFALPVRVLSFSLPVTYGIETLQQVVLRGEPPYLPYVGVTAVWAIGLWIVSVRLLRRMFVGG